MIHILLIPTVLYTVFSFIRLNFLNIRSFTTNFDQLSSSSLTSQNNPTALFRLYINGVALLALVPVLVRSDYYAFSSATQLTLTLVFVAILLSVLTTRNPLFVPLSVIFTLLSTYLLFVRNIVQAYMVLEVIAYTNLLFLAAYGLQSSPSQSAKSVSALLISFILNFVVSIALYGYCLVLGFSLGDLSGNFWQFKSSAATLLISVVLLLKLGTGPWLAGNVTAYSGYSMNYLVVYTLVSLFAVVPTLFQLVGVGAPTLIATSLVLTMMYISKTLHTVTTVKSLFAYSTVIMYSYLLLVSLH